MKKTISLLTIITICCLSFCGCGSSKYVGTYIESKTEAIAELNGEVLDSDVYQAIILRSNGKGELQDIIIKNDKIKSTWGCTWYEEEGVIYCDFNSITWTLESKDDDLVRGSTVFYKQ